MCSILKNPPMYLVPRSSWRYAQLKNQKTTHREDTRSNRKEDKGIFLNNRKANPQKDISGTVGQPCCPLPIVLNRRMDKFRMHITRKQPTKKKKITLMLLIILRKILWLLESWEKNLPETHTTLVENKLYFMNSGKNTKSIKKEMS